MPVSKALQRVLRIRNLEEEQRRLALETALTKLRQLDETRNRARTRERQGRELVEASVRTNEPADRQAGEVQAVAARKHVQALAPRLAAAEAETMQLRQSLLEKRVERRQAETLVEESQARDELELNRRSQQSLDDWHGSRKHGEKFGHS